MNEKRVEQLLRQYAKIRPAERLFSEKTAARLRTRLAPAGLKSDAAAEPAETAETVTMPSARAGPLASIRLRRLATTAAAAAVLAAIVTTARHESPHLPGLVVAGAHDKAALFHTIRGETAPESRGNLFYIGVRVDQPAYIRILAIDDRGGLEQLALDRAGATERRVEGGTDTIFGGYPLRDVGESGTETRIAYFLVIASSNPLDAAWLSDWISGTSPSHPRDAGWEVDRVARALRRHFGCQTRVVHPQPENRD